ncbi:YbjN domain-containing protein [Occultella glacieicola]|uniref:YbjN domain-containing protein n=1 Tax=Occultella glacieicola TaxID=2518684 RepID=A0ABY2E171_9MICO|nr:YbjN domain-containing protein [Occultella glacieicola]TDE90793.1 YbjN domain-containing protein [Occultella glacieicola]
MAASDHAQPDPADDAAGSEAALSEDVLPVDRDRLKAWLREHDQKFFVSDDSHLGGLWNGHVFTVALAGANEVLQIRAQWNRRITIERRAELMDFVNARHARTLWPKCFLLVHDDGTMRFCAESATPLRAGLSEHQLGRAIRAAITTALAVFAELDDRYPDPVLQAPGGLA